MRVATVVTAIAVAVALTDPVGASLSLAKFDKVRRQLLRDLPVGPIAPNVVPQKPKPYWSWDHIPTSYHGAVKDREFTDDEVKFLGSFQMVTIEKWYTPCGSTGPHQNGPSCGEEYIIEGLFQKIKALGTNTTTILYWNSMLDFDFYAAHAKMEALEEKGVHAYLRDKFGTITKVCNDGSVYCNMTTYDWTVPEVRELWVDTVINFTRTGLVDGIFADHSGTPGNGINIGAPVKGQGPNQYCNGAGAGHSCYNFTTNFTESFNSWHNWGTNYTQDVLSKLTGGPEIQGPYAHMNKVDACSFDAIRQSQANGSIPVVEAKGCHPSESCLAAYLAAAEPYTYLHCLYNGDEIIQEVDFPEKHYALGEPDGPAKEVTAGSNVWNRSFASGAFVIYDNKKKTGSVHFPNQPTPPPTQPLPPINCGSSGKSSSVMEGQTFGGDDVGVKNGVTSTTECCEFCVSKPGCVEWAWHHDDEKKDCHAHGKKSVQKAKQGVTSGMLMQFYS